MFENTYNGKRIAKNTLLLYIRMLFLMAVNLFTSRVILLALGVEDFGIYNVVGGFVALFAIVSKSLSGAASRFLNFEMGRGDNERLKTVFSSIVSIQVLLSVIIVFLAETIGLWFLNNEMVMSDERMIAANWCFQLSIITFCSNLLTIPYNASIIAHEKMAAFAYISIFEGLAKLGIAYLIFFSRFDRLIFYAILICILQLMIQCYYRLYCLMNFDECKFHFVKDMALLKLLLSYSSWGFIGSASSVLRNQGINVLINLFFGPAINAARAVSNQVLHAVDGFVNNFITAVRPQIVMSYASGDYDYVNKLVVQSAKFSFYLFFTLSLPIIVNCEYILSVWLSVVPEHSVLFVQLTLIYALITTLSHPLSIAQAATGRIRNYQLVIGGLQLLNLPVSYLSLKFGAPVESVLIVAVLIAFIVVLVSIHMIKKILLFDSTLFYKEVVAKVFIVTIICMVPLFLMHTLCSKTFIFFIIETVICIVMSTIVIYYIGLTAVDRKILGSGVKLFIKKISKNE